MQSVFISGSRSILHIPIEVRDRLDVILDRGMSILIGDAPGVDMTVQSYLADRAARDVTVYCGGHRPRNNVGRWPVRTITANAASGTRAFHEAKDRAMAAVAGAGFVIWDGESSGSLANIRRLALRQCYILVFHCRESRFHALRNTADRELFFEHYRGRGP